MGFDDIPVNDRVYTADRTRMASWWVGSTRDERDEDRTIYEIAEWDVATKKEIDSYSRIHRIDLRTGDERGKEVSGVAYTSDGELHVLFSDGTHEPAKFDPSEPEVVPEAERRDCSWAKGWKPPPGWKSKKK